MTNRIFDLLGIKEASQKEEFLRWLSFSGVLNVPDAMQYTQNLEDLTPRQAVSSGSLISIDPAIINVDAETYQFRSGGDPKSGVTNGARFNVDRWDPILHGDPVMVHERLDGTIFIADGHHRLDLAKRLNAQGNGPGAIAAIVLREADGYTPLDVRVIAAYKNMSYGHTNPVDAARVFKEAESGKVHTELLPHLQMDKGNLRISYTLSKLSDASLDKVQKGDVPIDMAAQIAQRLPNQQQQDYAMQIVSSRLKQNGIVLPESDYKAGDVPPMLSDMARINAPGYVGQLQKQRETITRTLH